MRKGNTSRVTLVALITLACAVAGQSNLYAQSPSAAAQHSQAKAALEEEPKLWADLVGMEFEGGAYPSEAQASRIFDEYDFQRGCQAFIWALPAMSMYSMREGSEKLFGKGNHILPIWKGRLRATTQVTTPNSDVIYAMSYLDLKEGPVVVESPPGIQGLFDDMFQRPIVDVGLPGPDRGQGGKYLLLPPDYDGPLQEGVAYRKPPNDDPDLFYAFRSNTYGVFLFWRAFLDKDGKGTKRTERGRRTVSRSSKRQRSTLGGAGKAPRKCSFPMPPRPMPRCSSPTWPLETTRIATLRTFRAT